MNNFIQPIVNMAKIYLEDTSDDEENVLPKVENYAEICVPSMNDKQFKYHFRMSPTTFEDLLQKMQNTAHDLNLISNVGYPRTCLDKELMITIWCLSNIESFRSVADRFDISKSTCWDILYRTSNLLLTVNKRYKIIIWPNRDRQTEISNYFNADGLPGIIGCIDGSHIKIVAPKEHSNSYVNRKHFHSLLLQGVCDHRLLFTDIYTGEAGSLHDYTLYRRSDLYSAIQRGEIEFYNDSHMIGDLAYKLSTNLLVGFKNMGNLTLRQKNFNVILNKSRVKIENAFALLKGRFRRLKFLETVRLDLAALLIFSACVLHNICILKGDFFVEDLFDINAEVRQEIGDNPHNEEDINEEQIANNAIIKRENIVNQLPIIIRQ